MKIENIVRNYIEKDFVMHFHLSRAVAYYLIENFTVSPIFIFMQGISLFVINTIQIFVIHYFYSKSK